MTKSIGVLFDLDGVLVDTEGIYTEFWAGIDKKYPTGVKDFAFVIKGSNLKKILDTYFPSKETQDSILIDIAEFEKVMEYRIFDGVLDFADELKKNSIPSCIVTSSSMDKVNLLIAQHPDFMSHFDGLITGDMVQHSKPHPECFQRGAELIGKSITDCYVFEDSLQGIEAGIKAGGKVIALATTIERETLTKQKANEIIDNFIGFNVNRMLEI